MFFFRSNLSRIELRLCIWGGIVIGRVGLCFSDSALSNQ
jgi:hypothetical protein